MPATRDVGPPWPGHGLSGNSKKIFVDICKYLNSDFLLASTFLSFNFMGEPGNTLSLGGIKHADASN